MLSQNHTHCILYFFAFVVALPITMSIAIGNDDPEGDAFKSEVEAPRGTVQLSSEPGGAFYVDETLLNEYKALKARVRLVRDEIAAGKSSSEVALKELVEIEAESARLRKAIDSNKTFVTAFKVFRKSQELSFPLADSRCVVIRGDDVTIRGWKGPGIKAVVEKTVLAKEQPPETEFQDIKMLHEVSVPEDIVGKTPTQRAADEVEFENSAAGRKMSPDQLAARHEFVRKLVASFEIYSDFQGKMANNLSVSGLKHNQGNRQLSTRIRAPGGGGSLTSHWKRHASVTIYVPPCDQLLVAGCMVSLDIEGIDGNLFLTTSQSRDRNYDGTFEVRAINGNLTIDQAPVRVIDRVSGSVDITATNEFVNSGTYHSNNFRTSSSYEPHSTMISNVAKNITGWFLRTNLHVNSPAGVIDIQNEYGNTHLILSDETRIDQPMRIISYSGHINVTGAKLLLETTPLYAHTMCGTLRVNLPAKILEESSFSTGIPQRSWHGLVTPTNGSFSTAKFERPMKAWENEDRKPGLDLISQSGRVSITTIPTEE